MQSDYESERNFGLFLGVLITNVVWVVVLLVNRGKCLW